MMKQVNIRVPRRLMTLLLGLFLTVGAFAQDITVKGHVKDATGEPVIGATVRVAGAQGGAVSDFDGNFTIQAPKGAQITVTYIGYQPATVVADANVVVTLQDDQTTLNDVVVIGYGVAKKSDLTGSVTALKPDMKNKGVVVNAQDMLAGKIAGVNVTAGDGTPGGGATIRIRGGSSLNASNDPLIVIDGVPMDNNGVKGLANGLSMINPQDIESFNVLKDASATAIYGSRGSNGVIIITTKKGRKGQKPSISYAGSATVSLNKSTLDVMDGAQYRSFIEKIWGKDSEAYSALGTANTDWQDLIYRTGFSHDHNVTVSGALKALPYRLSLGYTGQEGTLKNSDFKRVTAALNLNPSLLNDHLTMNLNAKGMFAKSNFANGGAVGAAFRMDPTQDPYSFTSPYYIGSDGLLGGSNTDVYNKTLSNFGGYFEWLNAAAYGNPSWPYTVRQEATKNPLALLSAFDTAYSRSFIGSADFDYKVHGFEDLRLHLTLGADVSKGTQYTDNPYTYPGSAYYGSHGSSTTTKRNLTLSTYAQYYKDFAKVHHFDIMAGYEWQRFWRSEYSDYVGYERDSDNNPTAERPHTPYRFKTENYLVSFFGRANYSLMDRYLLTFTIRDDGSSRFEDHWSLFPSAAFGWRINEESFLKNCKALSDLKLRLGWGKTGQQDVNNDYAWIPTYSMSTGTNGFYPVTGTGVLYRPDNYTPKLKWETTETYNIGLDWGIMNQRLSGSVDWYYRKTTDLLNYAPTKPMSAFRNKAWQNIGSLKNTGIEATIDWKAVQSKDFFWTLNGNVTYNHNEITDLTGVSTDGSPVLTGPTIGTDKLLQANQVGYATNSFYVFQQVYDENGKAIEGLVVDRNGDGQITQDDRYYYKNPAPDVTLGFASRMEYKNWDFSFSLRASFNNYVFNNIESGQACVNPNEVWSSLKYLSNRPTFVEEDNWQTYDVTALLSDRYVHNASFLKCDNITLGYSFDSLLKSGSYSGISGRVYATASNVFCITKYKGLDPEISGGYDNEMYPRPLSFILGLNLNF